MESQQIHMAMRDRLPVVYEGTRYDRITEYVAWYDADKKLQLSAVLRSGNYTIRVLADKVELWKERAV